MTDARLYPQAPMLAASVAVFRDHRVLLARRAAEPGRGLFALPGGVVEPGERMADAALRELREEVGVTARIAAFNAHNEVIELDAQGRARRHFVIASFIAHWLDGDGAVGPEASEVVWARRDEIALLPLVAGLPQILQDAFDWMERAACDGQRH